jgi:predicted PurR-regulated permease PerM
MSEKSAAPHLEAQPRKASVGPLPEEGPSPERVALVGLFTLAVFYTLFLARDILLPIFLALLLNLLLRPVVKGMKRLRIPEWLGAALVVIGLMALVGSGAYLLSEPAAAWIQRVPTVMSRIEFKLGDLRDSIEAARAASRELERLGQSSGEVERVVVQGPSLAEQVLSQTQFVLAGFAVTLVLLYFFLARGRHMLEGLIGAMPSIERRIQYAAIANTVQRNIASYLATVTVINTALGLATALVMSLLGMPNASLWGVMAATFNFIPYLGSAVTLVILTVVSMLTFDELSRIALPPMAWIFLTALEGNFLTPMIVGRRLTLNPIAVFLTVLFWGWLWGVPGALLAVPILAVFKIFCDANKRLAGIGALLGG